MDNHIQRRQAFVECSNCKAVLISLHRHDYRECPCFETTDNKQGVMIDGGDDYVRMGWGTDVAPLAIQTAMFEIDLKTGKYSRIEGTIK